MQRKFYTLTVLLFFISFGVKAQSGFSVGAFVAPTYILPHATFYNPNLNNLSLAYGVNIDYNLNKSWSVSIRPSFAKLNFFNSCVDTIFDTSFVGSLRLSDYRFVVSNSNCRFTRESSESLIVLPILIKYTFHSHKWEKFRKSIFIGNTMHVNLQYKNIFTDILTKENVTQMANSYPEVSLNNFFFPTIGCGGEYLLNENLSLYSDLFVRTLYFANFTAGFTVGVKARL